jgi:hypothetical protein
MNFLLLTAAFSCLGFRGNGALLKPMVLGLGLFSLEMQAITLLRWGSFHSLAPVNLAVLSALLCARGARRRAGEQAIQVAASVVERCRWFKGLWRSSRWNRCALLMTMAVGGMVLSYALFYVMEAVDPYHLMKVHHLERGGTLSYVPAADYKINVMSFLYELLLADIKTIPLAGGALFQLVHFWFFLLYVLVITDFFLPRDPQGDRFHVWCGMFFVPLLFRQFMLVKNDLFAALLALAALARILQPPPRAGRAWYSWVGLFAGFAMSIKATSFPVMIAAMVFLPYRTPGSFSSSRIFCVGGFLGGLVLGGLVFNLGNNYSYYGESFGPVSQTGNSTRGAADALFSVGRLLISLVDLGTITPRLWPGRGGWSGNAGIFFLACAAVSVFLAVSRKSSPRLLALCSMSVIAVAAKYPDADVAHRLFIAPLVLWMVMTLLAVLDLDDARIRGVLEKVLSGAAVASFFLVVWIGARQFLRLEYLRSEELLRSPAMRWLVKPSVFERPAWRMREINRAARTHRRVACAVQENELVLAGVDYQQVLVVESGSGRTGDYVDRWLLEGVNDFDYFVLPRKGWRDQPALAARLAPVFAREGVEDLDPGIEAPIGVSVRDGRVFR